jgi:hypothetical protein
MRKLTLEIDGLAVESFHTATATDARGTVRGALGGLMAAGDDTDCTVPSDGSYCPIMSCGSSCDANTEPLPTGPDQTAA